jgi:hypothetical protein
MGVTCCGQETLMPKENELTPDEVETRRDQAVRRALNTPPKPHKDMKKGARKKRQDERPTASGEK